MKPDTSAVSQNGITTALLLLLTLSLLHGEVKSAELIELIYPNLNHVVVTSADHFIIGTVDTTEVIALEISNFVEKSDEMDVRPLALTQDFPRLVQHLFGRDYLITHLTITSSYGIASEKVKVRSADFLADNRVDLQTFWESKEFQKIYSATVKDTAASHINVMMQGYVVNTKDLQDPAYQEKFKNYFIFRLRLNPGPNEILLRALGTERRILQEMPFTYIFKSEIDKKTEVPTSFQPVTFHLPENEQKCLECHRMKLVGSELTNRSAPSKICYPCHKQLTEAKFLHGPVPTWNCTFCHTGHDGAEGKFAPPTGPEVADLCYECHRALKADYKSKLYLHGPVAAGQCNVCHSPHGSNFSAQLRMDTVKLCLTCHGDRYAKDHPVVDHPIKGVPNPQDPTKELSCISCHNPHSGDTPNSFYTAVGLYQLCQECHKK